MNLTAPQPLLTTSLASGIVAPGELLDPGPIPSPTDAETTDFAKLLLVPSQSSKDLPDRSMAALPNSPDHLPRGTHADAADSAAPAPAQALGPAPTMLVPQTSGKRLPQEGELLPPTGDSRTSEPTKAPVPIEAPMASAPQFAFQAVAAKPVEQNKRAEKAPTEDVSPLIEVGDVAPKAPSVETVQERASLDLARGVVTAAPTAPELQEDDPVPLKTAEIDVPRPAPKSQPEPLSHFQNAAAQTEAAPKLKPLEQAARVETEIPEAQAFAAQATPAEPVRAAPKPVEIKRADNQLAEEPASLSKSDFALADSMPRAAERQDGQNAPIPGQKSAPQLKVEPGLKLAKTTQSNVKIAPTPKHAIADTPDEGAKPITAASPAIEAAMADGADPLPASSMMAPSQVQPSPSAAPAIPGLPMQAAPASPVSAAVPAPNAASQPVGDAIDQIVEQVAEARAAGRDARPELTLRHNEFGQVAMRIDANGSDWRATLSARDPGFVPAVQAALAERAVAASSEAGLHQNGFAQRGHEQHSQSQQGSPQSNAGFGGANGGNEQRYGSSTGSSQGSAQPYLGEEGDGSAREAAADHGDSLSGSPETSRGGALFA
ncbi:MAG: hypothetical protein AAFR64_02160 [Pseudomonadota bacterium]